MFPRGFTFIEILISLVLISLFLLGIDAMQVVAFKQAKINFYVAAAEQQLINMHERSAITSDTSSWNQQNQQLLPQASGQITSDKISIAWGNKQGGECERNIIGKQGCMLLRI